jgi:hypothetical protein
VRKIGQARQLAFQLEPFASSSGTRATALAAAQRVGAGAFVVRGASSRLVLSYVTRADDAFVRRFDALLRSTGEQARQSDACARPAFDVAANGLLKFVNTDASNGSNDDNAIALDRVGDNVLVHRSIAGSVLVCCALCV